MQLTFRAGNDNLDLRWTTNGGCILRLLILDEREPDDTGIGDVWKLNFKTIGLIVSPHDINIYDYGLNIPNNCYFVTSTYETGIHDLPMYLQLPSNIPKTLDIRRHGFISCNAKRSFNIILYSRLNNNISKSCCN